MSAQNLKITKAAISAEAPTSPIGFMRPILTATTVRGRLHANIYTVDHPKAVYFEPLKAYYFEKNLDPLAVTTYSLRQLAADFEIPIPKLMAVAQSTDNAAGKTWADELDALLEGAHELALQDVKKRIRLDESEMKARQMLVVRMMIRLASERLSALKQSEITPELALEMLRFSLPEERLVSDYVFAGSQHPTDPGGQHAMPLNHLSPAAQGQLKALASAFLSEVTRATDVVEGDAE